jgi:hypothetical protein
VLSNTTDVTAAPSGAAFPGTFAPCAHLSAMGTSHVRMPNSVPAAKGSDARLAAFWRIPAMTAMQLAATATVLPTAIQNRKHTVYKTRVNAGGDGASGPHPEREPA